VLIFGIGGGVSAYEGVLHILHPSPLEDAFWNYIVLAAAGVFEGASLVVALRSFRREKGNLPFWQALRASKDPATYTVIAEDSAALLGLLFAAVGVWASHRLELPVLDGVASVMIGLLLAAVAVLLIRESRGLLVGEGVRRDTAVAIRSIALADRRVQAVGWPLSMYIGPDEVLLTFDVQFLPGVSAGQVAAAVRAIELRIRERFPKIRRIYIEASSIADSPTPAARPDESSE
jgi:divalent metal cation (Fe/Co/Zn/Cd) transporter